MMQPQQAVPTEATLPKPYGAAALTLQQELRDFKLNEESSPWRLESLEIDVHDVEAAAAAVLHAPGFTNLHRLCLRTRSSLDKLHSASLIHAHSEGEEDVKVLASRCLKALEGATSGIAASQNAVSDQEQKELCSHYSSSISFRSRWLATMVESGHEALFVKLAERLDFNLQPESIAAFFQVAELSPGENTRETLRLALLMNWLQHKLVLLGAELSIEAGPEAQSTIEHSAIGDRINRLCTFVAHVDHVSSTDPDSAEHSPLMWHQGRHRILLEDLQVRVEKRLVDVRSRLPNSDDQASPTRSEYDVAAKKMIEDLAHRQVPILLRRAIESLRRLHCFRAGITDVSVYVHDGGSQTVASAVEYSAIGKGTPPSEALRRCCIALRRAIERPQSQNQTFDSNATSKVADFEHSDFWESAEYAGEHESKAFQLFLRRSPSQN